MNNKTMQIIHLLLFTANATLALVSKNWQALCMSLLAGMWCWAYYEGV